jgi:hypothetical protein
MKYATLTLGAAALAALLVSGCSESFAPQLTADLGGGSNLAITLYDPCGDLVEVPLLIRGGASVGLVHVGNDETTLYVELTAAGGWTLARSEVIIASTPEGLLPGHGPRRYQDRLVFDGRHDQITQYTYEVPMDSSWYGDQRELCVSVTATLENQSPDRDTPRRVQAWAEGDPLPSGNAFYFCYTVQICPPSGSPLLVTFPDGGETLCAYWWTQITWDVLGEEYGPDVRIELLHDGATCSTLAESTPNDGVFEWQGVVPCGDAVTGYAVRITDLTTGMSDTSDGTFLIDLCPE